MVTEQLAHDKPDLADLKNACKRHGITQDRIAAEAGVTRPLVVNVFARRSTSRNVVQTAQRLVADAERALKSARRRRRNGDGDGPA
jgi:transcriptional regulator with XRE-family HTH domain